MDLLTVALAVVLGYLIGSLSFARIVTSLATHGKDIAQYEIPLEGTGDSYKVISVGGNSVAGVLGWKLGMAVGILDIVKAILVVLAFRLIYPGQPYFLAAALAVMAGHIWPLYHGFHGGSGWSTSLGGLLVIDWLAALVTPILGMVLGMLVVRSTPVAMLSWMWILIPWMWFRTHDMNYVYYAIGLNVLFLLSLIPEFKLMMKYGKAGQLKTYERGSLAYNPMGRGFLRIAKFFGVKDI